MEKLEFELLALQWWQNPWYWGVFVVAFCVLLVVGLVLFKWWQYKRHKPLTPVQQFLRVLNSLQQVPFGTLEEQQRACRVFAAASKQYAQACWHIDVQHLSDETFVVALHEVGADAQFVACMEQLSSVATLIKFAGEQKAKELFQEQIACCIDFLCKK